MDRSEWRGPVGDVWAAEWRRTDRSFAGLAPRLNAAIFAAAPSGAFKAIDIGCGAGDTSLALARARPDAAITGVDISPALVAVAQERAADTPNATFMVADAPAAAAGLAPDLLFSRHGVMFFDDPAAAFSALHAAAAPGAFLVFSCFDAVARNPWATTLFDAAPPAGVPGPFAFADPDYVASLLGGSGWRNADPISVPFDYVTGQGDDPVADATEFFRRIGPTAAAMRTAAPDKRERMLERLTATLEARRDGDTVWFPAAAWIWAAQK